MINEFNDTIKNIYVNSAGLVLFISGSSGFNLLRSS
jgi:hypothetical protein